MPGEVPPSRLSWRRMASVRHWPIAGKMAALCALLAGSLPSALTTIHVAQASPAVEFLTLANAGLADPPLSADNVNLVFVVSPDLDYQATGDVDPNTANLTSQGLQRSLLLAPFLQHNVLGDEAVTGIYALEPMTHLQTAHGYPDLAALETIQQFALLNQIVLPSEPVGSTRLTGNSFPLNASYAAGQTLSGVSPSISCQGCQGLDFANQPGYDGVGDNDSLVANVVGYDVPGFYVFAAPWETTVELMASINSRQKYGLNLPQHFQDANNMYAISINPTGSASLVTYNSNVNPPSADPVLPLVTLTDTCTGGQVPMNISVTGGVNGTIPHDVTTNTTVYMVRHAEAHPTPRWDDGNYLAAGQWRALALASALSGKLNPAPGQVYSIDPAQPIPAGYSNWSYVRPSLTVEPYAIANQLPYNLVSTVDMFSIPAVIGQTTQFFFNVPPFTEQPLLVQAPPALHDQTILLAWEHSHFKPTIDALLKSYGSSQTSSVWPTDDYDTIWSVRFDGVGNLTVDNALCEGINSATLPATAPQF